MKPVPSYSVRSIRLAGMDGVGKERRHSGLDVYLDVVPHDHGPYEARELYHHHEHNEDPGLKCRKFHNISY